MQVRRIKAADASSRLPLPATVKWPDGVWDAEVMRHGTMSAEIFAPRGRDHQSPHAQDELYVIISGTAELQADGDQPLACAPGDLVFVPAGQPHHFEKISEGFATWVIFYGPTGGEATLAPTEPVTDQSNSQSP